MILRVCVVIPSFDDARTISEVVKDVVTATPFPVLIVDEGSETPVSHVLYSWDVRQALEEGRVRVLRSVKNRGRGAAIQSAIGELLKSGYTHMVTMDASGRYCARGIMQLVDEAKSHPFSLIVGDSPIRKNGFRLYPLFALQNMRFLSRRGDFDFEVLLRLVWRGVERREVVISATSEVNDRLWTSFLNSVLMTVSVLGRSSKPRQKKFTSSPLLKRAMTFILKNFGYRSGQWFARNMTIAIYLFSPQVRRGLNEYWKLRAPLDSWQQRQRRVWRQISKYLSMWTDSQFQKLHVDAKFLAAHSGVEPLPEAGGPAHVSANVGAWELTASLLESAKVCHRPDALTTGEIELPPFFGKLAPFDVTVFRRAGEKDCPLVFSFGARRDDGSYELQTLPMKSYSFLEGVPRELQVYHWAGEFVTGLEIILGGYPEQWFNFYPLWSAVPNHVPGRCVLVEELRRQPIQETLEPRPQPRSSLIGRELSNID